MALVLLPRIKHCQNLGAQLSLEPVSFPLSFLSPNVITLPKCSSVFSHVDRSYLTKGILSLSTEALGGVLKTTNKVMENVNFPRKGSLVLIKFPRDPGRMAPLTDRSYSVRSEPFGPELGDDRPRNVVSRCCRHHRGNRLHHTWGQMSVTHVHLGFVKTRIPKFVAQHPRILE